MVQRARARAVARVEQLLEDALVKELLEAVAGARRAAVETRTDAVADRAATAQPARVIRSPRQEAAGTENGVESAKYDGDAALWTYCILPEPDATAAAEGIEGIEPGSAVEAVRDGDLAALVSPVPLAEYGDEQLRSHLEDLAWVERTARRHEAVLESALREATIVPLRLCTLYRTTDGVRRLLAENRAALHEGLSTVAGCIEWGIKVFVDSSVQIGPEQPEPSPGDRRGATYLLRRQQERALADKASEVRARCVEVVHQRIAGLARASTTNPPQRPDLHGRDLTMLLNAAHLIERDRTDELRQTVATLQEEWSALGFVIELTGPWPPYNFVSGAAGMIA
jgi:hypothetical protein